MKLSTRIPFVLALIASPLLAQSKSKLKKELRKQEQAAKKDPDALYEAGKWAKEQELDKDAKRIFKRVLKLDANHAGANTAMGNALVEGKWLPEKEAKKLREAALEAEYSAKGYKKIDDVWVPPEEVDDARKGIFYYEGEKVSRLEMQAMQAGMVRHPRTGQLMNAEFQDKADSGYFPIGDGKWGDLKQANKYHSALSRPWMIQIGRASCRERV